MRLFIAICFNKSTKQKVMQIQNVLREAAVKGNFTREEHLHLTVAFLGEVKISKIDCIKNIMDSISIQPFTIAFYNIGSFKHARNDVWWIGTEENKDIRNLYSQLQDFLVKEGFSLPLRPFIPHLTIAREIVLKEEVSIPICKFSYLVNTLYLIKSERISGRLVYTKLYEKQL